MDHASAERRARLVAEVCCARAMDRALIESDLAAHGIRGTEADVAVEVVVSAFGWALGWSMGVRFKDVFVLHQPNGQTATLDVGQSHLFTAALKVATDIFTHGYPPSLPKSGVVAIASSSGEAGSISRALEHYSVDELAGRELSTIYSGFDLEEFRLAAGYPPS